MSWWLIFSHNDVTSSQRNTSRNLWWSHSSNLMDALLGFTAARTTQGNRGTCETYTQMICSTKSVYIIYIYIYTYVYICICIYVHITHKLITFHTETSNILSVPPKMMHCEYSLDELEPLSRSSQEFELKQILPNYLPNLSLIRSARSSSRHGYFSNMSLKKGQQRLISLWVFIYGHNELF